MSEWIKCSDRMPEEDRVVWWSRQAWDSIDMCTKWYVWFSTYHEDYEDEDNGSHWMEFKYPEPPNDVHEEET